MSPTLPILNLETATFDCMFGRGCDGICCRNGRPPIYPEETARIDAILPAVLAQLRPEARVVVERSGYVSGRRKAGQPVARVAAGWCVFFNRGCVLHAAGAREGDAFRYKPSVCAFFPLSKDRKDRWYVRQAGYQGEVWDLPCLKSRASKVPAAVSLRNEIELVQSFDVPADERRKGSTSERR